MRKRGSVDLGFRISSESESNTAAQKAFAQNFCDGDETARDTTQLTSMRNCLTYFRTHAHLLQKPTPCAVSLRLLQKPLASP